MKKVRGIYENGSHEWLMVARDPDKPNYIIDTNEYLIVSDGEAVLTDPGGMEIFPAVIAAISEGFDPLKIKTLFASHQDPDIISSLALWLEFNPDLRCYLSWLWAEFVPHFGGDDETIIKMPDEGITIDIGSIQLEAIPAHHLHSAGNFHLFDRKAKILFSGDIGAALLPRGNTDVFVEDFDKHIRYAEKFHQRWMGSNEAKARWCSRMRTLDVEMMCPQHGSIYRGKDVSRFIDWFEKLQVGIF